MEIKLFNKKNIILLKNKIIRAAIFCFLSTLFFVNVLKYQNMMGSCGVILFTCSFYFVFRHEKLIDMANSSKYRFSFLRQVFNFENFVYLNLPNKLKKFSVEISIMAIVSIYSFFISDIKSLIICNCLLIILKIFFRY